MDISEQLNNSYVVAMSSLCRRILQTTLLTLFNKKMALLKDF